jgi:ESS family glutamate:Na+ symporter
LLGPVFGLPLMAGALIEIGFVGGHGTAAGLAPTFDEVRFEAGEELGLGLATIGVLTGVVVGMALLSWGARSGRAVVLQGESGASPQLRRGLVKRDAREPAAVLTVRPSAVEPLALHLGLIGVAVLVGQALLIALQWLEQLWWAERVELFAFLPLFPLAMIGGVLVQQVVDRVDRPDVVDRLTVQRLQGLALDLLIVSALATLSLGVLADNLVPFLLLAGVGIVWNVGAFLLLAPRMIPSYWFERGIGDFGQAFGVTATGLLLLRVADPDDTTPAMDAFGYKQLGFEPFFGGGLVTAGAVPLIAQLGPWPLLIAMLLVIAVSLVMGLRWSSRSRTETRSDQQD